MRRRPAALCSTLLLAAAIPCGAEQAPLFEQQVQEIFAGKCGKCHGPEVRKAELDLSTIASVRRGGESGPVVGGESPQESLLLEMVAGGQMPPDGEPPLSGDEREAVRLWVLGGARSHDSAGDAADNALTFQEIVPLLLRRCVMCHGGQYQMGGLDLRQHDGLLEGGAGGPAVVPGDSDASPAVRRIAERLCPPKADIGEAGIEPATPAELAKFSQWIDAGAPRGPWVEDVAGEQDDPLVSDEDRRFWSFAPPRASAPPPDLSGRARTAVDLFVLRRLRDADLELSPAAGRRTLARRAALALTGLPPDQRLLDELLADRRPRAFERYVDRLLASPRYGEKWGRFWLDLAGYSDSEGKRNADTVRPYAWKYRDWVIRALNDDKPYDEFLIEQLAGDELVDWAAGEPAEETIDKLTATGFLRMAPDGTAADPVNRFSDRLEVISDTLDILGRGVMGLTVNCARCHTHKYDPIPQRDYYRLAAVFKGAYDEYDWLTPQPFGNQWNKARRRHLTLLTPQQQETLRAHNGPLETEIARLRTELDTKPGEKRKKELAAKIKSLQAKLREPTKIRALWDRGRPSPTFVYRRGDEMQPAALVGPGVPSVLTDGRTPFQPVRLRHSTPKTGRRLALARWLTREDHPLTARVIVNRIWHQHFGRGLVESLDNFGRLGAPCSHPELLDYLAVDFVQHGWSIKRLQRMIVTSAVWRQQSRADERRRLDPDNRLLSRMPMRRLTAEEVRDSMLHAAGRLSLRPFGEPDPVEVRQDGLVTSRPINGYWRRSIYLRQRRKEMPTVFDTFDLPQMTPNCTQRKTSTVVTQPLYLLNNKLVHELAGDFAERARRRAGAEPAAQIGEAFRILLSRPPSEEELEACLDAFRLLAATAGSEHDAPQRDRLSMTAVCHALLNSASLLYVD